MSLPLDECSHPSYHDYMTVQRTYREHLAYLWGDAGTYAHDAYGRIRREHFPELPEQLPIVIGITAYGACLGMTRGGWPDGARITLESRRFAEGRRVIDDVLIHEMLHARLILDDRKTDHVSADWYDAVRRLSPAVLGRELGIKPGGARKSVRVPNPAYTEDGDEPKTLVRKVRVDHAVPHELVARWPGAFRPDGYYAGEEPIPCPTY